MMSPMPISPINFNAIGQLERARRLREHIQRLKDGDEPPHEESLREQIAERAAEKRKQRGSD